MARGETRALLGQAAKPGGHEQGTDLVTVQSVGLGVQSGPADLDGRGAVQEAVLLDRRNRPRRTAVGRPWPTGSDSWGPQRTRSAARFSPRPSRPRWRRPPNGGRSSV